MASISNAKIKREVDREGCSYVSTSGTTRQEMEAAEVLLQMGLGLGGSGARRSIITEARSSGSELTLKATAAVPSSVIVSSMSTKPTPISMSFSSRSRSEPSAFVPVQLGGFSLSQGHQSQAVPSNCAVSIHPTPSPMTPQRVPISVVQRKETVGRNHRRTLSPQLPAITIRPINMEHGSNREILKGPVVGTTAGRPSTSIYPTNPSYMKKDQIDRPALSGLARIELDCLAAEPSPPIGHTLKILRNNSVIEKNNSLGGSSKITVESLLQRKPTLEAVGSNNQQSFSNPIPISLGGRPDHQNSSNWIRIVSPSQLQNVGSARGNILLPGTTLILTSNGSNNNNNKELGSNGSEHAGQQRMRQNKLMKKALRAQTPMSRDASEPIAVDEFKIPKEFWAKAFVQSDICHAAGILFKALFTPEEIQNCTLRGRNGTFLLDLKKRSAIFRAVGWMKNKNQNPYSFDSSCLSNLDLLTQDEKMIIEKKVFVERRYQTSRKIRDVPSKRRSNKSNQNHLLDQIDFQHNSLTNLSSEESNSPLEIVIKAEPRDVLLNNPVEKDIKAVIKCEIEDEPMDTEEDNTTTVPESSDVTLSQPTSPKQIKF